MSFRYSLNCDTLPLLGYDLLEDPEGILKAIVDAGYDGVDLPGNPDRVQPSSLRSSVESLGLDVPEVSGAWAWSYWGPGPARNLAGPAEDDRKRGVAHSRRLIDLAVELGARLWPACAIQAQIPELPFPRVATETLRENFLRSLRELCAYAAERGITVVIEPLNRYEAWFGVATTVQEVVSLIDELGVDNLGIQPDIYHMNMAESSTTFALRAGGQHLKHMHVNETNHYALGTGHADLHGIMNTLKEIRYTGYLAVYMPVTTQEAWQRTGPRLDLSYHLNRSLTYLKSIEEAVDLRRGLYNGGSAYCGDT